MSIRLWSVLAFVILFNGKIVSQSCLSGITTLTSQAEVDAFPSNYPGCTQIIGDLLLDGADINDLTPLGQIQYVGGILGFARCHSLNDFTGINVTTVNGILYISENSLIENMSGLESITYINGLVIGQCLKLQNLDGLQNITTNQKSIAIRNNQSLIDLSALSNITSINGFLIVTDNPLITTLNGLHNINPFSIDGQGINYSHDLEIANNNLLTYCDLPNICTYLQLANKINIIQQNASNCNSESQITAQCIQIPSPPIAAKLEGGALEIVSSSGLVLHGEDGNCHRLYFDVNGALKSSQVICP